MKRILPVFFVAALLSACVKDRVPNPDTVNLPQTSITNESFDADSVNLPAGWAASSGGWKISTSNNSIGYTGASGKNNLEINNSSATGSYTVTTKAISTIGIKNISVIYGARHSSNYSASGSGVPVLQWSADGGSTWTTILYADNPGDSNWYLINGGSRMTLPAGAANQASLQFQWKVSVVTNANGTYRIDDFQVFGSTIS